MSNIARKMPTSYAEAQRMLGGKPRKNIAHNTELQTGQEGAIGLVYHWTEIVTFYPNGMVRLNTGGYETATTKDRLNGVLSGSQYKVFQKDFRWYVWHIATDKNYDYSDGMTIDLNEGKV